ncbi:hypothetical protein OKA05_27160 [Luteolibacter arcticus]|uniref:Uncharacterized protein n=1 Tax=Luteolibacter arcticus TaxID=1581411 RepID=A0ABT3GRV5_9BACT|nr:hypothetical protein [Luteolibacter arcticus]MCW1926263.1 hypothetical protein [Luteolibacter arcticus]
MRSMTLAAWTIALCPLLLAGPEASTVVEESGSPAVDALVLGLVSKRPAPIPTGGRDPLSSFLGGAEWLNRSGRCATDEVEAAFQKLKEISPKEYPHLLKHRYDDRYSYSEIGPHGSPTRSGWTNCDVGDAVYEILCNEMSWVGGYKLREAPGGTDALPPHFSDYIEEHGGEAKWVESVSSLSRAEIDRRFLDWCIAKEEKVGFKDAAQRAEILEPYEKRKGSVGPPVPAEGEKPAR